YVGVSSIFFDNNVNQYRNEIKFKIIEENQNVNLFNIEKINYKDEITKKIYDILDKYFKEEIIEVNKDKIKKIESFLKLNENKIYKNLWRDKEIKKDIINLSESKINDNTKLKLELFKIQLKNEKMINDDINHKINDIDFQNKDILFEQLKRKRNIDNITVEKLIIARLEDLKYFEKLILSKRNNKCVLEEDIHEFLCETGKTGEIENIKNRLWILDEGLFFKKTISSDVSLTRNKSVKNIKSQKRPDIYITKSINNNEPDNVISDGRIVIFEIKRPELNNHDKSNDPNEQLLKYYDLVANGKGKAHNGRPLNIKNKAFYELISICDITEKYKQKLIYEKYIEEDSRGAYHKIFLEKNIFSSTLSFDYILEKAKERYSYLNKKDYLIKKEED
ncbi:MAG: hypothetical protein KFW07_00730, partial [Mycoplasmataceae bacterium]|nr:hypothetical protein [Mycoplasmataceae bacterium]